MTFEEFERRHHEIMVEANKEHNASLRFKNTCEAAETIMVVLMVVGVPYAPAFYAGACIGVMALPFMAHRVYRLHRASKWHNKAIELCNEYKGR